jgi:L-rhamnose isomerase/sugar isomerase
MPANFEIESSFIAERNAASEAALVEDLEHLGRKLSRRSIDIETIIEKARGLRVAIPSWGVGTGGTRFARFPGPGEPRDVFEKLEDCSTINKLVRTTPSVSLHIPWDKPDDICELAAAAEGLGLEFDAMNSNTFQDQPGAEVSYKFGSLSHVDRCVREKAIQHNIDCIRIGHALDSKALTVWVGDGSNFAGQSNFRSSLERYLDSMREIYAAVPDDWRLFIEHKMYEPAFYSTVISDWGTSYYCARELGEKAACLVDLGHHAPNVNIEQIVSRLIQFGKLGGFHFNDSKYGDDDLDAGSVKPFQLFLIFNELVDAELNDTNGFDPSYMLDQSNNVTDPIESLAMSAVEVSRAFVQALMVDRTKLEEAQNRCDPISALTTLKEAFTTDVSPILAAARQRDGGAIDPIAVYRASGYRKIKDKERPATKGISVGIV